MTEEIVFLSFFSHFFFCIANNFCISDGSTSAINKIRNVFRLSDEAYWIRRIPANNSASQESLKLASTVQYLNVPSSLSPSSQRPSPTKSTSSTTTPASSVHRVPEAHRPVVFISIQEHHSNLLPWRESCADIVVVPENSVSQLDLVFLEEQLILHQHRPLKLGSFSAGSNLTGVLVKGFIFSVFYNFCSVLLLFIELGIFSGPFFPFLFYLFLCLSERHHRHL